MSEAICGITGAACRFAHAGYDSTALLPVAVKPLPGLAAEMAGGDHFLQERRGAVFRIVESLVEDLHHRQHRIQPDHVGQRQRADWMVAAELHAGIEVLSRGDALLKREDRLV